MPPAMTDSGTFLVNRSDNSSGIDGREFKEAIDDFIEAEEKARKERKVSALLKYQAKKKFSKISPELKNKFIIDYLNKNAFDSIYKKDRKLKSELTKENHKNIVKKKWYEKLDKSFNKLLKAMGGDWWKEIIGFLLMMAIFDPKGKILGSIIDLLVNALSMILNLLARMIPPLIKKMWYVLWDVVPSAIKRLLDGVFKAIYDMFEIWISKFPDDSILGKVLKVVQWLFSKNSPILGFLYLLADLVPYFVTAMLIMKAFTAVMAAYNFVFNSGIIAQKLGMIAIKAFTLAANLATAATWLLTTPLGLAILGILYLIGTLYALWKFKDQIAGFFEMIFSKLNSLGVWGKILKGVIFVVFGWLYGTVKLFQSFSKIGVKKTFANIWTFIKETAKLVWKNIKMFGSYIWNQIKKIPGKLLDAVFDSLKYVFITLPKRLWDSIMGSIFEPLKRFWDDVMNWVDAVSRIGLWDYMSLGKDRKAYMEVNKQLRVLEKAEESGVKVNTKSGPKQLGRLQAALTNEDSLKNLIAEVAKGNGKLQTETIKKMEEITTKIRVVEERKYVQPPKIVTAGATNSGKGI